MTQAEFAALGRVEKRTQANYESGLRVPDANYLAAASERGVDVLYVITGRREQAAAPAAANGPAPTLQPRGAKWGVGEAQQAMGSGTALQAVTPDTTHSGAPKSGGLPVLAQGGLLAPADVSVARPMTLPVTFSAGGAYREYQVIPRLRVQAAAGKSGARQIDDVDLLADMAGVMALERDFMHAAFGRDYGFITVQVAGDSMSPTLIDGDVILVDTEATRVKDSAIYVVRVAGDLLVKRVQRFIDTSLVLKSDNPAYAPETIAPDAVHALRVVGRMVRLRVR